MVTTQVRQTGEAAKNLETAVLLYSIKETTQTKHGDWVTSYLRDQLSATQPPLLVGAEKRNLLCAQP